MYPTFQDVLISLGDKIKGLKEGKTDDISLAELKEWRDNLREVDKSMRERMLVMTVAAECGWKVASDMSFIKKGTKPSKSIENGNHEVSLFQAIWQTKL